MNTMLKLQLWLLVALGCVPSYGVDLRLETTKPEQIAGEPADLGLVLVDDGGRPVYVTKALFSYDSVQISNGSEWYDCYVEQPGTRGVVDSEWVRVDPQDHLSLGLPRFVCTLDGATANTPSADWREIPGKYRLRVRWSHRPSAATFAQGDEPPDDALEGSFQSNEVAVTVLKATGVNAEALTWARENRRDPISIEVVNRFPTSRYASIVNYWDLLISERDPGKIARIMEKKSYPLGRSVPDPTSQDGWREIPSGEEMARWRIEAGADLLRNDPEFPYLRQVRLSMAVSYASLGMKTQATRILRELAKETGTEEAEWASEFLALKQW